MSRSGGRERDEGREPTKLRVVTLTDCLQQVYLDLLHDSIT